MRKRTAVFIVCLALAGTSFATSTPDAPAARFDDPDLWRLARGVEIGGTLRLEAVPLDGEPRALDLARFRVFSPGARVTVHGDAGDSVFSAPENAYFRGVIAGDPGSLAVLTVRERGGLRGLVMSGGSFWVIDSGPGVATARGVDAETELAGETAGFRCAADELGAEEIFEEIFAAPLAKPAATVPPAEKGGGVSYTARVAIETDWEFFQKFGNAADATDYAADLIAYASSVYAAELATSLEVASLSLWSTSGDPWSQSPGSCGLFEFGRYWNDNHGGDGRTIAHFLSGKNPNSGIAWVGVLCRGAFTTSHGGSCPGLVPTSDNYGGGYGYSGGIDGNFDITNPAVLWDVMVVAHEIGHNFDSPHTHCYAGLGGNAAPVDECYAGQCGQGGCYCGATSLPCAPSGAGCGTLMSYCHFQSGGLSNIAFTLGAGHPWGVEPDRVPSRMNSHVVAQAASNPGCLDPIAGPGLIFADGFESGDTSAWSAIE